MNEDAAPDGARIRTGRLLLLYVAFGVMVGALMGVSDLPRLAGPAIMAVGVVSLTAVLNRRIRAGKWRWLLRDES
ncbi:MAG: hypothetical protein AAGD14_17035 [Planctomycetota bacterium]